ncbi:family 61 glycoside hydrolase [Cryphonectria parasitica EP155]|uniref:lytic cellulose monooxygenase (C4-dehydrogenating) n=1 Tax=Cryphonectria parasitica (strain ATCC 38755 / EP155) TaxID=660469 RepID=A0A9P4YB06_CRYP1|nr:family 61 glycoside hydrolase [Cryphonectria parasitica EP155]KAF3769733.1 family 61 glycoside hydrolase [Cryphonectria parasitica EP155]
MSPSLSRNLFAATLLASAAAHSHIDYVLVNGVYYPGFIPQLGASGNPADTVGWFETATDDGFIAPSNYTNPNIICHENGAPPRAHMPVAPGDIVHFQWNGWPLSHDGPVQTYLAPCDGSNAHAGDGCASVDKTKLEFFKIDDSAPVFLNESGGPPGFWATEVLIASNNSWLIQVPTTLRPGPYVLRHEIIALHYANVTNGAQNYPQCFNVWVSHGASNTSNVTGTLGPVVNPRGIPATEFYHEDDPGILIDIYKNLTTYVIPGPTLAADAVPIPLSSQRNMLVKAAGTPVVVSGMSDYPIP